MRCILVTSVVVGITGEVAGTVLGWEGTMWVPGTPCGLRPPSATSLQLAQEELGGAGKPAHRSGRTPARLTVYLLGACTRLGWCGCCIFAVGLEMRHRGGCWLSPERVLLSAGGPSWRCPRPSLEGVRAGGWWLPLPPAPATTGAWS